MPRANEDVAGLGVAASWSWLSTVDSGAVKPGHFLRREIPLARVTPGRQCSSRTGSTGIAPALSRSATPEGA
jgi:hypothetical protein